MKYLLILTLSIFDAFATLYGIDQGYVREANPIMAYFLAHGVGAFLFVKLGLTTISLVILKSFEQRKLARFGTTVILSFYIILACLHALFYFIWKNPQLEFLW